MRTAITLEEFIFVLNQDEDMRVTVIDYMQDEQLFEGWKSSIKRHFVGYEEYRQWFVQDFNMAQGGIELTIVELQEELD